MVAHENPSPRRPGGGDRPAGPAPEDRNAGSRRGAPGIAGTVRFGLDLGSPPNPWDNDPAGRKRTGRAGRIVAGVILVTGMLILAAALLYGMRGGEGPEESGGAAVPAEVGESAVPASGPGSDGSRPDGAGAFSGGAGAASDPGNFRAPSGAQQCALDANWLIYSASAATSCPFAENVAAAMASHADSAGDQTVTASSPVTGQRYRMMCTAEGGGSFTCRGGTGAIVVLEQR